MVTTSSSVPRYDSIVDALRDHTRLCASRRLGTGDWRKTTPGTTPSSEIQGSSVSSIGWRRLCPPATTVRFALSGNSLSGSGAEDPWARRFGNGFVRSDRREAWAHWQEPWRFPEGPAAAGLNRRGLRTPRPKLCTGQPHARHPWRGAPVVYARGTASDAQRIAEYTWCPASPPDSPRGQWCCSPSGLPTVGGGAGPRLVWRGLPAAGYCRVVASDLRYDDAQTLRCQSLLSD